MIFLISLFKLKLTVNLSNNYNYKVEIFLISKKLFIKKNLKWMFILKLNKILYNNNLLFIVNHKLLINKILLMSLTKIIIAWIFKIISLIMFKIIE